MAFRDIIGQDDAIQALKNAYHKDRLAHAYLFYGVGGVGKERTALAFARWLNCPHRTDADSCGVCSTCRKIGGYNHADVKLVFPRPATLKSEEIQDILRQKALHPEQPVRFEQNVSIVVDDIREVQQQLIYPPLEAAHRFVIIREVEKMNVVTANALLKTLEEPPERTLLILTTNHIHSLMPTILSRCQRVRFRNLLPQEIEKALRERYNVTAESAQLLSHLANGSLGDVIGLDEQSILARRDQSLKLLQIFQGQDTPELLAAAEIWQKDRAGLPNALMLLSLLYRDIMLLRHEADNRRFITNQDWHEKLAPLAQRFTPAALEQSLTEINESQLKLQQNANPHLLVLHLFFWLRRRFPARAARK